MDRITIINVRTGAELSVPEAWLPAFLKAGYKPAEPAPKPAPKRKTKPKAKA